MAVLSASENKALDCNGNFITFDCGEAREQIAFAVYSTDDDSLTFYYSTKVPSEGDTFRGKTATTVYTDVENTGTSSSSMPWSSDRQNFVSAIFDNSFKTAQPASTAYWFYGMTNLTKITGLEYLDTSQVQIMLYMFYNCNGLTSIDASGFNTSNVTDMSHMFDYCYGLTSLNVSKFDTAKVTDMSYMFRACNGLTRLDLSKWDTVNVTDMSYMFRDCIGLTSLDVSGWNTAKVTHMQCMFTSCSVITTIYSNDNIFVTTAVTSGDSMFTQCINIVGGNGTTYSSSNATYTMAHVDTASNPGYFTAK